MELLRSAGDLPLEAGQMAGRGFRLRDLLDARYIEEVGRLARSRPRNGDSCGAQAKTYALCVLNLHALAAVCPDLGSGASQDDGALVPVSRSRRIPAPVETVRPDASGAPENGPAPRVLLSWVLLRRFVSNPWLWVLALCSLFSASGALFLLRHPATLIRILAALIAYVPFSLYAIVSHTAYLWEPSGVPADTPPVHCPAPLQVPPGPPPDSVLPTLGLLWGAFWLARRHFY